MSSFGIVQQVLGEASKTGYLNRVELARRYWDLPLPLKGSPEDWCEALGAYVQEGQFSLLVTSPCDLWWYHRVSKSFEILLEKLESLGIEPSHYDLLVRAALGRGEVPPHLAKYGPLANHAASVELADVICRDFIKQHKGALEEALANELVDANTEPPTEPKADAYFASTDKEDPQCKVIRPTDTTVSPSGPTLMPADSVPSEMVASTPTEGTAPTDADDLPTAMHTPPASPPVDKTVKGAEKPTAATANAGTVKGKATTSSTVEVPHESVPAASQTETVEPTFASAPVSAPATAEPAAGAPGTESETTTAPEPAAAPVIINPGDHVLTYPGCFGAVPEELSVFDRGGDLMLNGNPKLWYVLPQRVPDCDTQWIVHNGKRTRLTHRGSVQVGTSPANGRPIIIMNVWEFFDCDRLIISKSAFMGHPEVYVPSHDSQDVAFYTKNKAFHYNLIKISGQTFVRF